MRLVEVVMLMGAHCVSPVEHTPMMTDATKVQCAVVIEKDTDSGTMSVTPPEAARDPQVAAAVERFRLAPADSLGGTKIVPAWAPAGSPTSEVKLPPAKAPPQLETAVAPESATPSPAADVAAPLGRPAPVSSPSMDSPKAKDAPVPDQKVATLSPPPQKPARAKAAAAPARKAPAKVQAAAVPKQSSQCKGSAVARWYTTAEGRKKYRCVKPASGRAPAQLY